MYNSIFVKEQARITRSNMIEPFCSMQKTAMTQHEPVALASRNAISPSFSVHVQGNHIPFFYRMPPKNETISDLTTRFSIQNNIETWANSMWGTMIETPNEISIDLKKCTGAQRLMFPWLPLEHSPRDAWDFPGPVAAGVLHTSLHQRPWSTKSIWERPKLRCCCRCFCSFGGKQKHIKTAGFATCHLENSRQRFKIWTTLPSNNNNKPLRHVLRVE